MKRKAERMAEKRVEELKDEIVNHPKHYKKENRPAETIEVIRAMLTPEEYKGYLKGNIIKYMDRYPDKGRAIDLEKAGWYLKELSRYEYAGS